ncbi:potassium channel family protein [Legionella sp. D16C41]|uniref:potassium channel family protein n=1 Tax=Legionella sp. D16C41 TaxID=3402688 RepID=UPI003AF772BC
MLSLVRKMQFLFLFFTILLFCFAKALEAQIGLWHITDIVLVILIVTSILVIGEKEHRLFMWLTIIGILQLIETFISHLLPYTFFESIRSFLAVIFFGLMTIACLQLTLRNKVINMATLFGSLSAYLFIGLSFAYLYLMIYTLDPYSLSGLGLNSQSQAIYYSFITLTTVGFGDIVATKPIVQCLTWMEAFFGQAYLAIFISQLVSRYVADRINLNANTKQEET